MEANIIVNLVPAMAKYQKKMENNQPQTKYRNSERFFTQHTCQSFLLTLKPDQPLVSTDTPHLPYLELPTLMIRYQGMLFLLLLQKYQIQKSHHTQPSGDGFILQKDLFFQNSEIAEVILNYVCLAKCVLWILNSSKALGKVEWWTVNTLAILV